MGFLPGEILGKKNMGKKHCFSGFFLGKTMEFLGKNMKKHGEHWKTLLVFLVFPVVRFSDIPWEVAHCFLTVSTKYSMVKKKQAHGFFLVVRFFPLRVHLHQLVGFSMIFQPWQSKMVSWPEKFVPSADSRRSGFSSP